MNLHRRLLSDALLIALGRSTGIGLALVINILLANGLTKEDYGRYLLVSSLIIILSTLGRFGLHRVLLREIAIDEASLVNKQLLRNACTLLVTAIVLASFVLTAVFYFILDAGHDITRLTAVAISCMAVLSIHQILNECLRALGRIGLSTVLSGERTGPALSLLFLLLTVALMLTNPRQSLSLCSVMSVYLVSQIFAASASLALLFREWIRGNAHCVGLKKDVRNDLQSQFDFRTIFMASSVVTMADLLAILIGLGDVWIAGAILEGEELTNWVAVSQLVMIISAPLSMISMTVIPIIPKLFQEGKINELQNVLQDSATIAFLFCLPLLLVSLTAPSWFLSAILGEKYADASLILRIVCMGKMVLVLTGASDFALELTGNQRVLLVINLLTLISLGGVGGLFAYLFGVNGLAIAILLVSSISNLSRCLLAWRFCGVWTFASMNLYGMLQKHRG